MHTKRFKALIQKASGLLSDGKREEIISIVQEAFGGGDDHVKSIVVAIESQIRNAKWDERHIKFLFETFKYIDENEINETAVNRVYEIINESGLCIFRGTMHS